MSNDFLTDLEEAKVYLPRFKLLYGVIAFTAVIFVARLWFLQIIEGTELREFSERNRIKEEKINAPRGMFLDRDGRVLVDNHPGFDATITPQYASHLKETAETVSKVLGIDPQEIIQKVQRSRYQNGPFRPVRIKDNLSRNEVIRVERIRLDHPGLDIVMSIKRTYLLQNNGAQLFGYVGEVSKEELPRLNRTLPEEKRFQQGDVIGKSGVEQYYDRDVRGLDGLTFVQVDAHGREITSSTPNIIGPTLNSQEATPGYSLKMTIDKDIQEATYNALIGSGRIGGAISLNPKTGEIYSWVSGPSFDPNEFSTGISPKLWGRLINDPYKPLRNKVVQDHNPPGSTFKTIVALAGLQEGAITPTTTFSCPGFLKFGKRLYHCHLKQGHGAVNVTQALERSCDVFFYKVGMSLGIDKIAKYGKILGIGEKTGVLLNGEVSGLMPTSEWKKKTYGEEWQPGENLSNAIGQGFILSTPIQMAQAISGIANTGPIFQPYMIKEVINSEGKVVKSFGPRLKVDLLNNPAIETKIKEEYLKIVKEGMHKVVEGDSGTAKSARIPGIEIAGKTGTVQLYSIAADQIYHKCIYKPMAQRHHGWFVGFAPFENPEIVVTVFAEHGCSGSGGAAPVAHDIMLAYFKKFHPEMLKNPNTPRLAIAPVAPPPEPQKVKKVIKPGSDETFSEEED